MDGAAATVRQLGRFFIVPVQQVDDDFLQLGGVADLGHEVDFDFVAGPSQQTNAVVWLLGSQAREGAAGAGFRRAEPGR